MASVRAQQRDLLKRMRAAGMSTSAMATEFGRRFGLRPRAAWRHANGLSLTEAAEAINSCAYEAGLDPSGNTVAMTSAHLCEHEGFPGEGIQPTGRRVTPQKLALLARAYGASITDLLDLRDYEALSPADRLVIDALQLSGHGPGARSHPAAAAPPSPPPPAQAPARERRSGRPMASRDRRFPGDYVLLSPCRIGVQCGQAGYIHGGGCTWVQVARPRPSPLQLPPPPPAPAIVIPSARTEPAGPPSGPGPDRLDDAQAWPQVRAAARPCAMTLMTAAVSSKPTASSANSAAMALL